MALRFHFLEARPVIDHEGSCRSFRTEEEYETVYDAMKSMCIPFDTYWSLYGIGNDGEGELEATLIGDFETKEIALEVQDAILAPMMKARDALNDAVTDLRGYDPLLRKCEKVHGDLYDFIAQCSTEDRV
jgi:hypothetical protein